MPRMLSCVFVPLLLTARSAVAQDGPVPEAATTLSALGSDDECRAGSAEQCGLNAMQLRHQSEANVAKPAAPYQQCAGMGWKGPWGCPNGYVCFNLTEHYSQCKPRETLDTTWKKYNGSTLLDQKSGAPLLAFYVYKAVDAGDYPPTDSVLGSIGGVLSYLHTKVASCKKGCEIARRDGLERIARYKVQTRATQPLFLAGMNFGPQHTYEHGQCTGPEDCDKTFAEYGYAVGCQNVTASSDFLYSGGFYSLPGSCPSAWKSMKSLECKRGQPGGLCQGVPTGTGTCTWSYTEAGAVTLNELEGITNYTAFKEAGGEEYNMELDKGVNMDFWDNRVGKKASAARIEKLDALFVEKYPDMPSDKKLPIWPFCDFSKEVYSKHSAA